MSGARAERISRALFYGELKELQEDELQQAFHDVPTHTMEADEQGLVDLLVAAGAALGLAVAVVLLTGGREAEGQKENIAPPPPAAETVSPAPRPVQGRLEFPPTRTLSFSA